MYDLQPMALMVSMLVLVVPERSAHTGFVRTVLWEATPPMPVGRNIIEGRLF